MTYLVFSEHFNQNLVQSNLGINVYMLLQEGRVVWGTREVQHGKVTDIISKTCLRKLPKKAGKC